MSNGTFPGETALETAIKRLIFLVEYAAFLRTDIKLFFSSTPCSYGYSVQEEGYVMYHSFP